MEEKDLRQKDTIVVEFTEDNLNRFLKDYYSNHRKTKNPIVECCLPRSMNKIITITNRIVQNNHKKHRALYVEYVLKELGLEKLGICETDLKIHYLFPTLIRHDLDNMIAGMKEILDPFSDLGVILDDNYKIIKSITATASYEKGVSKMIMTFENCKFDIQATLEAMEKERIKREKRETTMAEKKKSKKKSVKKK
jgi:Holliday junction resolvase RusA-like endonuclease